jgi:hypothetical protein
LAKVDLPKNIVDQFSPPASGSSVTPPREKPAAAVTELRAPEENSAGVTNLVNGGRLGMAAKKEEPAGGSH